MLQEGPGEDFGCSRRDRNGGRKQKVKRETVTDRSSEVEKEEWKGGQRERKFRFNPLPGRTHNLRAGKQPVEQKKDKQNSNVSAIVRGLLIWRREKIQLQVSSLLTHLEELRTCDQVTNSAWKPEVLAEPSATGTWGGGCTPGGLTS